MVRIRVKIQAHDGSSKKSNLTHIMGKTGAWAYKIIETKEAFVLITDNVNMDKLLTDETKQELVAKGLEIVHPPEYDAARTVLLKNVDSTISALEEGEIAGIIGQHYQVKKIVKIPNSKDLLKIVFQNSHDADRAIERGVQIQFQRFQGSNIERELFVPIVPCFRCFNYGHFKRNCPKPNDYLICSTCASEGHIYKDCPNKTTLTCINCGGNHRTLAAKCPVRKDLVRTKIKEIRTRSRSVPREGGGTVPIQAVDTTQFMKTIKLPDNYLAVMAAAITVPEKRETEVPGTFHFIMDEMLKANNIPTVKFPETVISGYKDINSDGRKKESEKRKRARTSEHGMTAAEKKSSNGAGGGRLCCNA